MLYHMMLQKVDDTTYDIVISIGAFQTEFAQEITGNDSITKAVFGKARQLFLRPGTTIRAVKFIIAGALVLSMPFSQFLSITAGDKYVMSYLYFGNPTQQLEYMNRTGNTLNTVSPSYFDINPDGSLKQNNINKSFVKEMQNRGMKVVPFLSNHWDREAGINAVENAEALSDAIAAAVEEFDLDGVNVDIENLTHHQREAQTRLVKLLRAKIPDHKEVSVAVAANPKGWSTGWHGSYDYAALGEAADHLFLMTYDEHYEGGEDGPVASLPFVEDSISYALQFVPAEKIVLGIPFFGRIWADNGTIKGKGISLSQAERFLFQYTHTINYSETARSPVARVEIKGEDPTYTLNGATLGIGSYTLWYENNDSIKEKLQLVNKYNLKGAGNWSAGQETGSEWDFYDLWVNGKYFSDIADHFAKDDIITVATKGLMKGMTSSEFQPAGHLTRAQGAVIATRLLGLENEIAPTAFSDVTGHWAEKEISVATRAGILVGYEDGTFRPETVLTREETAVLLFRLVQSSRNRSGKPVFSDVDPSRWSYQEIAALSKAGILMGYEDDTFRPESQITRGEMAALIRRVQEQKER